MKILFLGDIVGKTGCDAIKKFLPEIIKKNDIGFVIVNGENADDSGVGITEKISEELFKSGVDVITTGNHIWDQKEISNYIGKEKRLLRPQNLSKDLPGKGFGIFTNKKGYSIGVLNLMGNIFMKNCDDAFNSATDIINENKLKQNLDFFIVDFHGEITSEKMAIGHYLDGKVTLVVGTHTHVPTSDFRILDNGTAYQTDAGMCGDYNSVIGMNKENSINKFLKKDSKKHFPSLGSVTLSGIIVEGNINNGLAKSVKPFIFGGVLKGSI